MSNFNSFEFFFLKEIKFRLNSQENEIFKKGDGLYGLTQNLNNIKAQNQVILVEGYLDVISLDSNEITTSVAALGTAVSENQILKLWNHLNTPIVCFDGDEAGRKAMKNLTGRVLKILKPGKDIYFAKIPNSQDPDDFVNQFGKEGFNSLISQSKDLANVIFNLSKTLFDFELIAI